MRPFLLSLLACSLFTACGSATDGEIAASGTDDLAATEVVNAEFELVRFANSNSSATPNFEDPTVTASRAAIDKILAKLQTPGSPLPSLKNPALFGSYKRAWSDFLDPARKQLVVDPNNTYLHLPPPPANGKGTFWLLGNARAGNLRAVGGIKVEYAIGADPTIQNRGIGLLGTFVKAGFGNDPAMNSNQTFVSLTDQLDNTGGILSGLLEGSVPPAPDGPKGIEAFLQPIYLSGDGKLLVLRADQRDFGIQGKKDGASDNPQSNKLFILTKSLKPENNNCGTPSQTCAPGDRVETNERCTLPGGKAGKLTRICSTTCATNEYSACL